MEITADEQGTLTSSLVVKTYSYLSEAYKECGLVQPVGITITHRVPCDHGINGSGMCGRALLDDLMHFAEITHRDTAPKVEPLPEQIPVVSVTYQVDRSQDPLRGAMSLGRRSSGDRRTRAGSPEPDADRTPEFLEQFPLDALQMLGTLQLEGDTWALVSAPDGERQRWDSIWAE